MIKSLDLTELSLLEKQFWFETWREPSAIFLDIETTGLSPMISEIIEISALKISKSGEFLLFSSLIKPQRPITASSELIHGISDEMVSKSPHISEVLPKFMDFIEDAPLFGHSVSFDLAFLVYEAAKLSLSFLENKVFDTCLLARQFSRELTKNPKFKELHPSVPEIKSHKLEMLAKTFGIDHKAHRASEDVMASFKITGCMLQNAPREFFHYNFLHKSYLYRVSETKQALGMSEDTPPYQMTSSDYQLLLGAIPNQNLIELSYSGGSKGTAWRPVKPYAFLPGPQGSVLLAECSLTGQNKTFKLDRILKVKTH